MRARRKVPYAPLTPLVHIVPFALNDPFDRTATGNRSFGAYSSNGTIPRMRNLRCESNFGSYSLNGTIRTICTYSAWNLAAKPRCNRRRQRSLPELRSLLQCREACRATANSIMVLAGSPVHHDWYSPMTGLSSTDLDLVNSSYRSNGSITPGWGLTWIWCQ